MAARIALGLAALLLSIVAPVHAAASIEPAEILDDQLISSAMVLYLNIPDVDLNADANALIPLTNPAGLNQTTSDREAILFEGNMILADTNNYNTIKGNSSIAYLCCDTNANNSSITPSTMLETLMENSPKAIILYSLQGNGCELNSDELNYWAIYSMNDPQESTETLNLTEDAQGGIKATISGRSNVTDDPAQDPQQGEQSGNNSAVAMSILYSITGLITLLFLVIIATGAVRAHRYPERYGPREGYAGRPRQSRAKGLARAVLDTLPIVKFGDNTHPPKGDPEHELESIPEEQVGDVTMTTAQPQVMTPPAKAAEPPQPRATTSNADSTGAQASSQASGPTAMVTSSNAEGDDGLGCSICTEDFTVGEDVRVLPCNHKYHPQCVDPWLTNVSGTCPLCRLDLRPSNADGEAISQSPTGDQTTLAPPLENDDNENEGVTQPSTQRSRISRLFDINRLRHASVEERIAVLRRYRTENEDLTPAGPSSGEAMASEEETSRRAKLTDRLRDKFRIRTTRRGGDGPPPQGESSGAGT